MKLIANMKDVESAYMPPAFESRYTTAEVAAILRLNVQTVRILLEDGGLCGSQRVEKGHWTVGETCLRAYIDKESCRHRLERKAKRLNLRRSA